VAGEPAHHNGSGPLSNKVGQP